MDNVATAFKTSKGRLQSSIPKRIVYLVPAGVKVATLVRWSFLLYVFTIPFETIEAGFTSGSLSLARAAGLLFFATCLVYPKQCFARPPRAMWWFVGYIMIYGLNGIFIPEELLGEFFVGLLTRTQLIIFLWVAFSILRDEKLARSGLLAFSMASLILSLGMLLQIPGFYVQITEGRITAVGANANGLAFNLACAVLIIVALRSDNGVWRPWRRALSVSALVPLLVGLTLTGSRGGIGGLVIGASLYLVLGRSLKRKWALIFWGMLTIVTMVYMVVSDPAASSRWEQTYYEGNTSGRDKIFEAAITMISEQPLFGWQPVSSSVELGRRLKKPYRADAHNLYLSLLIEVGLAGMVPFLVGLWLCMRAAWKARKGRMGVVPFVLLAVLVAVSVAGTTLIGKSTWLLLALGLASASILPAEQGRRARMLLKEQPPRIGRQLSNPRGRPDCARN
jgi:O-Antigen ligase